jgi:hypothetical protein
MPHLPCNDRGPMERRYTVNMHNEKVRSEGTMKRNSFFVLVLMCLVMVSCTGQHDRRFSHFEEGRSTKTRNGAYWVLDLTGSWLEMGRQYGGLMATELRHFHAELTADLEARGMERETQLVVAEEAYNAFSRNLQDVLVGISQTSGLTMDQTLVLNAGMMLMAQAVLGSEPPSACSGIAVWNGYTTDGNLIFGRNWDIDREAMRDYMRYLAVVVFHPNDGYAFANIHPLGNVYLETGMNSQGLFIELNNGEYSDPTYHGDREDTTSLLVSVMTRSSNVQQAVDMLASVPADISPEKMKDYLELSLEEGGAYHPGTVIQVVALPAQRAIWIRGCDYAEWDYVALDEFF